MPKVKKSTTWRPSGAAECSAPLAVPEPVHRVSSIGVSSGMSMRSYPRNYIQAVKDICLFYTKKASGQYSNSKLSNRYVHQMADEVLKQLSGVAAQVKRYEQDPEIYQALLDEWNENFPPSLGIMGTPKAIAERLQAQSIELSKLKEDLEVEKSRGRKDISDMERSMDAQLQASRSNIIAERKQLNQAHTMQVSEFQQVIAEKDSIINSIKDTLISQHNDDVTKLNRDYDAVITKYKIRVSELETQIKSERAMFDKELNKNKEKREKDKELHRDEVRELEEIIRGLKRSIANGMYNSSNMPAAATDDDVDDIASTNLSVNLNSVDQSTENESSDDSSSDSDSDDESVGEKDAPDEDPNEEILHLIGSNEVNEGVAKKRELKLKKQAEKERLKREKLEKKMKSKANVRISGVVAGKVRAMKDQIQALNQIVADATEANQRLRDDYFGLVEENSMTKRHLKETQNIVEELRIAMLTTSPHLAGESSRMVSVQILNAKDIVKHTPHFLAYPDRRGIETGKKTKAFY